MSDNKHKVSLPVFIFVCVFLLAIIFSQSRTINKLRTMPVTPVVTSEEEGKAAAPTKAVKSTPTKAPTKAPTEKPTPSPEPTPTPEPMPKEVVLVDNDYMTITYERMYEDDYGNGMKFFRMQLYMVNKSDKDLLIEFGDVTVNDEMTTIGSIYNDVLAHKSRRSVFTLDETFLSIDTLDEIEVIECKLIIENNANYKKVMDPIKITMDFREVD